MAVEKKGSNEVIFRSRPSIVLTVKKQAEHKLEKEVWLREDLVQKLLIQRDYCHALEEDNRYLRKLLKEKGINAPPPVEPIIRE
ncbi:voltage-gated hydrogen channel 1-like [Tropilaelaps mercedesae]|uniref:Voltage-gated hydrogen channel 1-like n=1 Tax=Tropilaelaps mercedesae TaxID=418985 RepID=A0A1V9Y2J3_9ACAR|nr:voltage-gated hydrogen channel 1-like [Tropilaelaps mercedesae]